MAELIRSSASRVPHDVGGETALIAEAGGQALGLQHRLERVVDLRAPAQRLLEGRRADRGDHELLDVDAGVGVRTTVEDVHHRHRKHMRVRPAEVAEQLEAGGFGGGAGHRERHTEQSVGAEAGLVRGAVQIEQHLVDGALLHRVQPDDGRGDLVEHTLDGLLHTLAQVAVAAVTQFHRLVLTGGRAGRHGRPGQRAVVEGDLDLDGGVSARIQDLASSDLFDDGHENDTPSAAGTVVADVLAVRCEPNAHRAQRVTGTPRAPVRAAPRT